MIAELRREGARHPLLSASVAATAVGLGWVVVQLPPTDHIKVLPFMMTLVTGSSAVVLAPRVTNRLLSPFSVAVTAYSVIFGFIPLIDEAVGRPDTETLLWVRGGWVGWIALILLIVGFALAMYRLPDSHHTGDTHHHVWPTARASFWATVLILIALTLTVVVIQQLGGARALWERFGVDVALFQLNLYVLLGVFLVVPGVLLYSGNWLTRPTFLRGTVLFGFLAPLGVVIAGLAGARWRAMTLVVALLAIWHYGYRRLRIRTMLLAGALFILAFATYGAFRHTREIPDLFSRSYAIEYVETTEFGQFRDFVVTLDGVPDRLDYQMGRTFLSVIPGLPFQTGGAAFTSTFHPGLWEAQVSLPTPLPGELYMNFGLIGILLGMPLFGALLALPEHIYAKGMGKTRSVVIYAFLLVPSGLLVRGEFTTFVGFTAVGLLALWVGSRTRWPVHLSRH